MAGRDNDQKLTAAARLAHVGYREVDDRDKRVSWSEESCQILGLPLA